MQAGRAREDPLLSAAGAGLQLAAGGGTLFGSFRPHSCDHSLVPREQLCCQMLVLAGGPRHHREELHR